MSQSSAQDGIVGSADSETSAELVEALRAHAPGASTRLYDRYADSIHGLLFRLLGPDPELEDLVQEVFMVVLVSIGQLRDPTSLGSWILGIAVRSAKGLIRRRKRKRWLIFVPSDELPEPILEGNDIHRAAMREVFTLLDRLPADERIALVLHRVEGMSLAESAAAAGTSLATFKRRLARGESRFFAAAETRPALAAWLEGSAHRAD